MTQVSLERACHGPGVQPMGAGDRASELGSVDYNPHFFQFSGHISYLPSSLLPSLNSLDIILVRHRRGFGIRMASHAPFMTQLSLKGPPTSLGCTAWAPLPVPCGHSEPCNIIHTFSSFRPIFLLPQPDDFFRPGPS